MGILTFLAIPYEFLKGTGSVWHSISQLSYKMGQIWSIKLRTQFLCLSIICEILGYFCLQIMLNQLTKQSDS